MPNSTARQRGSQASDSRLPVDVVVVGGGVAGLSAALALSRARRSVVVVDSGRPRNAPAAHAHGYLTRDGIPPLDLVAIGRREVTGYGGVVVTGTVTSLARSADRSLRITLDDGGSWDARRVLVATGLVDELPDIPGLRERWGRDVVHCQYCFGWELRDASVGVLATGPLAAHQALMWRQWSSDVSLFLHNAPVPTDDQYEQLAARAITVVEGVVAALEVTDDHLTGVRMQSGRVIPRDAVVIGPRFVARHALLDALGVSTVEHALGIGCQASADATGQTAAQGVWVAGNVADVTAGVMQAAASGVAAAAGINADLTNEDTAGAVAAYRAANRESLPRANRS